MASLRKGTDIGLAGGRRVNIDELAKDSGTRKKLEDLLMLMDDIERHRDARESAAADVGPEEPKQTKRAQPA